MVEQHFAQLDEYSQLGAVELALSRLVENAKPLSPVQRSLVKKQAKEALRKWETGGRRSRGCGVRSKWKLVT